MAKILDVGCGPRKYVSHGDIVTGIDINPKSQADVIHDLNVFPWPFKKSEFDGTYSSHCLEHLREWVDVLREVVRVTKDGQTVELLVPHFSSAVAYGEIGHINFFTVGTFTIALPKILKELKLEHIELRYLLTTDRGKGFFQETIHKLLTFLANTNPHFCERVWCYWFGGFNEMYLKFRVVKGPA